MADAQAPADRDTDPRGGGTSRPPPEAVVRSEVIAALGLPPGLLRLAVVRVWAGCYRVNVFTGADAASARVAHSYFVKAADGGGIVSATPAIVRLYP